MDKQLTLGSLFDGSGGFPLGGMLAGIKPVWASEIEPFPIRVTTKRLPFMKHYGDVSTLNGANVDPVDIITFGSPCQDMSVAGRRAGLDGSRSNLFYEAVRIAKEMREATNGRYPTWLCWENVPGAFSSNGGNDFKAVLDEIRRIKDPEADTPRSPKWPNAGCILADDYSLAWRVLDAQYFGVAQRRKRIFLVADLAGQRAGKVLFESEGVSGYTPQGFRAWEGIAGTAEEGTSASSRLCLNDQGGGFMSVSEDIAGTLRARMDGHPPVVMDAVALENHPADSRVTVSEDGKVQTLTSRMGTGGNNVPLIMRSKEKPVVFGICAKDSNAMKSNNPRSGFYEAKTTRTLDGNGGNPVCNQGGMAVVAFAQNQRDEVRDLGSKAACVSAEPGMKQQTYVLQGSMIGRADKNGPQGSGIGEDVSFTLDATDRHAIAHPIYSTSKASYHTIAEDPYYVVRRLTPTECARLQGFPDWWCSDLETPEPTDQDIALWSDVFETHRRVTGSSSKPKTTAQIIKWLKRPNADSAEYKLWGNGVALPCVHFVMCGIAFFDRVKG